ncbi:hypothetical protein VTK73DRAFT_9438 [Phialemonium thermophilum]|uniref:Microbial-type PARG catalytic domain-containing protein n=1 Tax=Phialemonium thermophilum TaxID=223376 RepID=A0ABR3XK65_9PEZI
MPVGSSRKPRNPKQKPSEVALEAKKQYIPIVRSNPQWKTYSYLHYDPLSELLFAGPPPRNLGPPEFYILTGDPADTALQWASQSGIPVPLICGANDKRPGGDWETGVSGYEGELCRRSSLAAALATPGPGSVVPDNFPIPTSGVIWAEDVVVFRGPHDSYDKLPQESWWSLPVCSVPPVRGPKLTENGTKYSFETEREVMKMKLRGALRACAYHMGSGGADCAAAAEVSVVLVGDFGLGSTYRNPPQELAELWRDVFLYDPDIRGRIRQAAFVFDDPERSTAQLILADLNKKNKNSAGHYESSGKGKTAPNKQSAWSSSSIASASSSVYGGSGYLSDFEIFRRVFDSREVRRVMGERDSRYGLQNLLTN